MGCAIYMNYVECAKCARIPIDRRSSPSVYFIRRGIPVCTTPTYYL